MDRRSMMLTSIINYLYPVHGYITVIHLLQSPGALGAQVLPCVGKTRVIGSIFPFPPQYSFSLRLVFI